MASERKGTGRAGKSGNRLTDKVTVICILTLTAVFGALIVDGRSGSGRKTVPADTTAPVTTTSPAATSETTAKPAPVTSTTTATTTAETSAEATAEISAASTPAPASRITTKTVTTAPVKTLVLTTAPTTTAAAETVQETTVSVTETEPPPTNTTTTSATTTAVTTTRKTTTTRYGFPADINKITYEGLIQVPGVGEKTAREIIAFRERNGVISNLELLLDIYGIGESTIAGFSTYLYVRDTDYQPITTTETTTVNIYAPETSEGAVTAPPSRQCVNINSEDAGKIASKLLLSNKKAEAIVRTREMIGGFTAIEELLLVEGLTDGDIADIKDYVLLTDRGNDEG